MPAFSTLDLRQMLTLNNLLQVIGVSTGLYGNFLINQTDATGYFVWMVSNIALVWLQIRMRLYLLMVLFSVYLVLCFQGLNSWAQKTPETIPDWAPSTLLQVLTRIF